MIVEELDYSRQVNCLAKLIGMTLSELAYDKDIKISNDSHSTIFCKL